MFSNTHYSNSNFVYNFGKIWIEGDFWSQYIVCSPAGEFEILMIFFIDVQFAHFYF